MKKEIAIIVLVWNNYIDTRETIVSVLKSEAIDFDIFVVDNASSDNCIEKIREFFYHQDNIYFILNKENLGYAEGNNIAIRQCMNLGYQYFFILNNDLVFNNPNCIVDIYKILSGDSSIGVVAPNVLSKHEDETFERGDVMDSASLYNLMMKLNGIKIGKVKNGLYRLPRVSGCFMALSRKCLELNNGFSKDFFMYCEEDDFCIRVNLSGLKVIRLEEDYGIKHLGGVSDFVNIPDWKLFLTNRNRSLIVRNFKKRQRLLYCSILFAQTVKNIIKLIKRRRFRSPIIYLLAYFEGIAALIFYKRLSMSNSLLKRGKAVVGASRIYGIKTRK